MDKVSFGKRLNNLRKEKQMTSEQLSERCEMNAVFIRQIESAAKLPSLPTLVKLCNALEVSPEYLLCDSLDSQVTENIPLSNLENKLKTLTPDQVELVSAIVDTIISQSEK